jgi:peptidoglycan-associated lipoprotein
MNDFSLMLLGVLSVAALGCHHDATVKTTPAAMAPAATAQTTPPAPTATPASPNVAVDDDLARQCSLDVGSVTTAPKFGFDESQLLPEDRDVLAKIATCVISGPLKGKHLKLVGRADPRGTDEYNLGLGSRRANIVNDYLTRMGVKAGQLASTTRGDLDAKGTDDDTWKTDRRVDVKLM